MNKLIVGLFLISIIAISCNEKKDESTGATTPNPSPGGGGDTISAATPCTFDTTDNPDGTGSGNRHFYMGFTTWNYSTDEKSKNQIYGKILESKFGDMVGLHWMDGVPWTIGDTSVFNPVDLYPYYNSSLQTNINDRITGTIGAKSLYVAIDQINSGRTAIANTYGTSSPPSFSFDDSRAKNSYTNYVLVILHRIYSIYNSNSKNLPKIYLNLSSEASDLIANNATNNGSASDYVEWHKLVDLISFVNTKLDTFTHTDSSFQAFVRGATTMVSVALKSPKDGTANNESSDKSEAIEKEFPDVHPYIDMVGVSTYGYIFYDNQYGGTTPDTKRADPSLLESNWLSQALGTIAGSKDVGITETSWIAQNYDVSMNESYVINSSNTFQKEYLTKLLTEMNASTRWKFLMWFTVVDFDPLWSTWSSSVQIQGLTWRDSGLFEPDSSTMADYNSGCIAKARPAWSVWSEWTSKSNSL